MADGGTGLSSYAVGDVLYFATGTSLSKLAKPGTPAGEVLTFAACATAPSWGSASAGLAAASVVQMEAGSSTTVATTPGRQEQHPSAAKVWAQIAANGTLSSPDYGVACVNTDCGAGIRVISFTTAFTSTVYAAATSAMGRSNPVVPNFDGTGTGSIRLVNVDMTDGAGEVDEITGVVFFGVQ